MPPYKARTNPRRKNRNILLGTAAVCTVFLILYLSLSNKGDDGEASVVLSEFAQSSHPRSSSQGAEAKHAKHKDAKHTKHNDANHNDAKHKDAEHNKHRHAERANRAEVAGHVGEGVEEHAHSHGGRGGRGARLGLLSREVVDAVADEDHAVMIAFSNYLFRDLALNLYLGAEEAGVDNMLVCAFDNKLEEYLVDQGVPVALLDAEVVFAESDDLRSATFKQLNRLKYAVIAQIVKWGYTVLASDVDVVVMRNPFPWLKLHGVHTDMMLSVDRIHTTSIDTAPDLETQEYVHFYCIGIMYIRPTPASKNFLTAWVDAMHEDKDLLDQNALMALFREDHKPSRTWSRLSHVFHNTLRVADLPAYTFCNGHVFYTQRLPQRMGYFPFMAHSTFQFGRLEGKINAMRTHHLFHDPPSYYSGKFLSFDLDLDPDMLVYEHVPHKGVPHKHIALGKAQNKQIFTALAIARALGRTLIMPRVWCLCDLYWWFLGDGCTLSGTKPIGFPTACPLDHILNPHHLLSDEFGLDFRESTFLDNPKVPARVLTSRVEVSLCLDCDKEQAHVDDDAEADDDAHLALDPDGRIIEHSFDSLHFHTSASDAQWIERLQDYSSVSIIHFSSVKGALSGLENQADVDTMNAVNQKAAQTWCCAEEVNTVKLTEHPLFSKP